MHESWFKFIEGYARILEAGYQLAKEFEHGTLIGDVREYFIKMFLSKILPETMGVGSGEIIDRSGARSNEIDTIIYSKNFPVLRLTDDKSLFPVESVVATIEVKSSLDSDALVEALENCKSVTDLRPSVLNNPKINEQVKIGGTEVEWAFPATYIFGYKHFSKNFRDLTEAVQKWADSYKDKPDKNYPALLSYPTLTVTEGCLAFRTSWRLELDVAEKREIAFAATKTDYRIHIFVCDLLDAIARRTFFTHPTVPHGRFAMEEYFDTAKLIKEKVGFDKVWDYIYL